MKSLKLLLVLLVSTSMLTSCYVENIDNNNFNNGNNVSLNGLLNAYDLWYVDINQTVGYGETPFLQKAFTISFLNGSVYANNNLVGIGSQGNGLGIKIGYYDTRNMVLDVNHNLDGFQSFDVHQIDGDTIELYNPNNDTSYFLHGYQRNEFDYNFVFYDNIHYFLQEYDAWEKTYTSEYGTLNQFDNENYLQFLAGGNDKTFRSSQDETGLNPTQLQWDYQGIYGIANVSGNDKLKVLTLDYGEYGNESFELSVINDGTVELLHAASGTLYEFKGRGYIQYLRTANAKTTSAKSKKRKQRTAKKDNPRENTRA